MSFARYEVLLPEKYNDGSAIEQSKYEQTWFELFEQFGALTLESAPRRGMWVHQLERYEDDLVKVVLDLLDTEITEQFMRNYKERLTERFEQIDVWMVAFPIRII